MLPWIPMAISTAMELMRPRASRKQPSRGKHFPKNNMLLVFSTDILSVTIAAWDAKRIRKLWKATYDRRPKGYDRPEEYAARRHGVPEEDVHVRLRSRALPEDPLDKIAPNPISRV